MTHTAATALFWICGLLLVVAAVRHYLRRAIIPPVCWLLLAGVIVGALRRHADAPLPSFRVGPGMLVYGFLPLLIFDSSRKLDPRDLREVWPEAGLMSLFGPLVGMIFLGGILHVSAGVPLLDSLLFGALLSATDPVSVTAVFDAFPVPKRLRAMVEGESLLNDGVVVVLFTVLTGRLTGETVLSVPGTLGWFVVSVLGALGFGALVGGGGTLLLRVWHEQHDRFIGALIPLVTVYFAFAVAEHSLGLSGVLSVMTATLTLGHLHIHGKKRSASADQFFDDFWGFGHQLANSVLFFVLGIRMGEHAWRLPWWIVPVVMMAMLAARAMMVYGGLTLTGWLHRVVSRRWQHVLNIGGLRGALSVVLLLMLPPGYAHRHLFLCLAFALIFFTILINTFTMRIFLRRTELRVEDSL